MATHDSRERVLADCQFGSGATAFSPAEWWLGLSTTKPNDDGSNFTEPVGGSYGRCGVTNNTTNFPAATTTAGVTTKVNGAVFPFSDPTGDWGTLAYYGWFLTNSGGTPEFSNPLDTPIRAKSGNTPVQFDLGLLVMPFD